MGAVTGEGFDLARLVPSFSHLSPRIHLSPPQEQHARELEQARKQTEEQVRLQMALESLHSQSHQLIEGRRKEEGSLDGARSTHASLKSAQSEKEKALLKNQSELDALNETLRQVSPLSAPVVAVSESERPLRRPAGSRQRRVRQRASLSNLGSSGR